MSNLGTTKRALGSWAEAEEWWWRAIKLRPSVVPFEHYLFMKKLTFLFLTVLILMRSIIFWGSYVTLNLRLLFMEFIPYSHLQYNPGTMKHFVSAHSSKQLSLALLSSSFGPSDSLQQYPHHTSIEFRTCYMPRVIY